MNSREMVKAALDFKELSAIPTERDDVTSPDFTYGSGGIGGMPVNTKGLRTDEWGTEWVAYEDGVCGEVKTPILDDWAKLDSFKPPYSVLREADMSRVNRGCEETNKFVLASWTTSYNLFERMQHLRGSEQLFYDLAYGEAEVYRLRDMLHEYFMVQAQLWMNTDVDGVHIADDWGTQVSLLISPDMWREFFKPCYREYCDLAHRHGKYILMHSDGYTEALMEDLIEIGVHAVNTQIFCMDMGELARKYHHRLAFWGEIDRQWILPHGTTDDCRKSVRQVAEAFFRYGRTGVVGQVFWGKDISEQNIAACYDEWKRL